MPKIQKMRDGQQFSGNRSQPLNHLTPPVWSFSYSPTPSMVSVLTEKRSYLDLSYRLSFDSFFQICLYTVVEKKLNKGITVHFSFIETNQILILNFNSLLYDNKIHAVNLVILFLLTLILLSSLNFHKSDFVIPVD